MDEKCLEWWRCSGTSVQQQVTMSRSQPAETRSNKSNRRIRRPGDCFDCGTIAQIDLGKFSQGEHMRVLPRKHHHSRRRTLPLRGTRDTSFQSVTKCDDGTCKNLHDSVMLFNGTDALQGIGERMMKDGNAV